MRNTRTILLLMLGMMVAVYIASCGRPPEPEPEEPQEPSEPIATVFEPEEKPIPPQPEPPRRQTPQRPPGVYELVWVEPRIVEADTMMMLITADRIDSVEVSPSERSTWEAPSIAFRITSRNCPATVRLTDSRGTLMRHLLDRELSPGYYKLTLSTNTRTTQLSPGSYYLTAEYCGQRKRVTVKLD